MIKELEINSGLTVKVLTEFIRHELRKTGVQKGIIGLSGGIDSAVVAFLAEKALGKENLICLMMPYKTSSKESLSDAEKVVKKLGVSSCTVDITPMVDPYFEIFEDAGMLRRGNKMARERMSILYDFSSKENALVIGTSNKSEILLGYGTIFGDLASAINPVGDLYKTQVRELAEFLGVPDSIIKKPPSADLWSGQSDEEELGFSYKKVDRLLYYMVERRYSDSQLKDLGYESDFIKSVRGRIQKFHFKRVPPVIAKISGRTFGYEFRYARDWGK